MAREDQSDASRTEAMLQEAETLTWALLDDNLNEIDAQKLASLLEASDEARARYVECVQLHVDLQDHFAETGAAAGNKSGAAVVLPNLMPGSPIAESRPPVIE